MIVEPDILKPGSTPNSFPGLLQVDEVPGAATSGKYVGAAGDPGQCLQQSHGSVAQEHRARTALAARQIDKASTEIHLRPTQRQNFVKPRPGQKQQENRADHVGIRAGFSFLLKYFAKSYHFGIGQEALAGSLLETTNAFAWITALGMQSLPLSPPKHHRQHGECSIGLVRRCSIADMEAGDVTLADLIRTQTAEARQDHALDQASVMASCRRLQLRCDVLGEKALGQLLHAWDRSGEIPQCCRILVGGDFTEDFQSPLSRRLDRIGGAISPMTIQR